MARSNYDPVKAHEYYMRTRELKGRKPSRRAASPRRTVTTLGNPPAKAGFKGAKQSPKEMRRRAQAKVGRLNTKVNKLEVALTQAKSELSKARQSQSATERKNSDGKTTAKERQDSKEYRDKNKAKIEKQSKKSTTSSGSSSKKSSSSGSTTSDDSSTVAALEERVSKIQGTLKIARAQLSVAKQSLGQLSHSETVESELLSIIPISRKESVKMEADFGGYATRSNVECADGRVILPNAFQHQDTHVVPLVWNHGHREVENVLGHCKLENRADGVYAYAYFNSTPKGQHAKEMVKHGDVKFLSIFANRLNEQARRVKHGFIREVSLVFAGANPKATIDNVAFAHSDGEMDIDLSEAIIHSGVEIELFHAAATDEKTDDAATDADAGDGDSLAAVLETLNPDQQVAVNFLLSQALSHSESDEENSDEESSEDEEQEETGEEDAAPDEAEADSDNESEADDSVQHSGTNSQEDDSMTFNVFDRAKHAGADSDFLRHAEEVRPNPDVVKSLMHSAQRAGSLKAVIEDYALEHGIENIDYLFPDAKNLTQTPAYLSRRMEWVSKVLGDVRKVPFSRLKSIVADITMDEARARGFVKGNMKQEEFFSLSKRETTPQTVYKRQSLDRDDILDITDFDVVVWLKAEMKVMLDEEIASAILISDGRSLGDIDKILETHIRPIATDAELYTTTVNVNLDDANSNADEIVDAAIRNRKYYKGSGTPTFYTTETVISAFLTQKDAFNRRIYTNVSDVASALRVKEIVAVETLERDPELLGIMVNLSDYTIGADRGGQATMFDDFDIKYNKQEYLIETRLSGALTVPKAAIVFRKVDAEDELVVPLPPARSGNTITVPTVTGVVYKNGSGTTLTTGSPTTLTEGQTLKVIASPTSGHFFENDAEDEWTYSYKV